MITWLKNFNFSERKKNPPLFSTHYHGWIRIQLSSWYKNVISGAELITWLKNFNLSEGIHERIRVLHGREIKFENQHFFSAREKWDTKIPKVQKTLPEAQRTQKLTPWLGLNLATIWHLLHLLQIWPPDGATCNS